MSKTPSNDDALLDSVRAILLRDDREQIDNTLQAATVDIDALKEEIASLQEEVAQLRAEKADAANVVPTIQNELSQIADGAVQRNHAAMAEALGPLIGAATTVQIRKSKQEMADALSPVMGTAISSAIQEALRDFQRSIDAQMTQRAESNALIRRLYYRSKGTSESEAAMRNALPYNIREIFLIQKQSGLLLSHFSDSAETTDSDLVSAMLTAIRDFVGDAFSADGELTELTEVQYGEHQIVIKSGEFAYAAAVVEGIVPAGLTTQLQMKVAAINGEFHEALETYDGDPETLPNLESTLADFSAEFDNSNLPDEVPRDFSRLVKGGVGCGAIAALATLAFIGWFVFKLFPIAWSGGVSADKPNTDITISTVNDTWLLAAPQEDATQLMQLPPGTKVELVAIQSVWRKVEWQQQDGTILGWTQSRNVTEPAETPFELVTPVP